MCVCVLRVGEVRAFAISGRNKPEARNYLLREVKGCQKWVGPLVLLLKKPR